MPDAKHEMTVSPAKRNDESEMGSETSVCERMSSTRESRPRVRSNVMEWWSASSAVVAAAVEVEVEAPPATATVIGVGTGLGLK